VDARIVKLEELLDRDYLASLPAIKKVFAGRTSKSDRTVILEQFTSAADSNCAGNEKACGMLLKTYKPSELVLVQYHQGNPRSDPMDNPDAKTRREYYTKAFPVELGNRPLPASIFNGQPKGWFGDWDAERPYKTFRAIIEPLLEEDARVSLAAKVERGGDKIDIAVTVSGLANPGTDKKLHIVLVEETVRYVGQNRVRLHHHVVRACPGSVAGKSLTEAASNHNVSVNVGELRAQHLKHLGNQPQVRSFLLPTWTVAPIPPPALEHLRVVAFVQDDSTREILQAVQVEVK
jgi:hypothetical protein